MMISLRAGKLTPVFLLVGLLSACSDDAPDPVGKEASEDKVSEQAAIRTESDRIFNPTPEERAADLAKEKARLPFVNELPDVAKADRSEYLDMDEPLMGSSIYLPYRTWEEKPEVVADDVGMSLTPLYGRPSIADNLPPELIEAGRTFREKNANAFDKADAAKIIESHLLSAAESLNGKRLVKVKLYRQASLAPYNMETKEFVINNHMFQDRTEYTEQERRSAGMRVPRPLKSFLYGNPGSYHFGFTGAAHLDSFKVEDEQTARMLEGARANGVNFVVYGFVKRVKREHLNGVVRDDPYTYIQPHFIDIIEGNDGKVLYTIANQ